MMPAPLCRPLFFLVVLFAPLGVVAPNAIVPLLLITALWQFSTLYINGEWRWIFNGPVVITMGLITVCALTSVLWSLNPVAGLITVTKLVSIFLAIVLLLDSVWAIEGDDKKRFIKAFLI